jgi:hypothetical protein
MAIEYFCAYHSYLDSMEELNDTERGRLFTACLIYSKTGEAPQLRGNERFVFPTLKAQIDRDKATYDSRCKKNSDNIRKRWNTDVYDGEQPCTNDTKTKEKEKEKEKTKENNNIPPTPFSQIIASYSFSESLMAKTTAWLKYKSERRESYKEQGLKSLLTQIQKNAAKYGEQAVIDLMEQCMAANWAGIIWDRLMKGGPANGKLDGNAQSERVGHYL